MSFGDVVLMLVGLLGGLGIFLFGMHSLGEGLEKAAGTKLKPLLQAVTKNRFLSILAGVVLTVLMQSSGATTVMTVGFVSARLMTLTQAVGVIMGANIGTTVTPLLMSLEGLNFGMIFAFISLILGHLPRKQSGMRTAREFAPIVMGVALLFIGMEAMKNAMAILQGWEGFAKIILSITNPLVGVLVGMVLTVILSSSAACVGILQALASQGLIPLSTSIFVLFGMNIGTCMNSLIAASGCGTAAKRAALVHLLFNVTGTFVFFLFACLAPFAQWIEAAAPGNLMLQIALVHIIFNVVTTLLLIPCAGLLEKAACALVPDRDAAEAEMKLKFFNERFLTNPAIAVSQLYREVQRMGDIALENYRSAMLCFNEWNDETATEVNRKEDLLDYLKHEISARLVDVRSMNLNAEDAKLAGSLFQVVSDLERVGDHSVNILEAAETRKRDGVKFTNKVSAELNGLSDRVVSQLETALDLFRHQSQDPDTLSRVEVAETEIDNTTEALRAHHVERVKNRKCSAKNGMIYLDMLTNLERVGDHAENIATFMDRA